jgi:hypothetical protein
MDLATVLLVLLPLISLAPKYFLILHTLGGAEIEQTGWGFGDYVHNLLVDGSFRSCAARPFTYCAQELCNYSTRMPLLPLIYAGLSGLVGTGSVAIAIARCTLSAGLLAAFLLAWARDVRVPLGAVALMYGLYLGPQALKHVAALEYEEGLLVDLEACLAIAVTYLLRPGITALTGKRLFMSLAAVALAVALYFIKTTALLVLIVVLGLLVRSKDVHWRVKALALVCAALPFAAWGAHNYLHGGVLSVSSSWNGENLYRGASAEGLALYPEVSLDRIFDSKQARLLDGRVVALSNLSSQQCFANEWAWNDFYAGRARAWLEQQPAAAVRFTWNKAWTALFELRHTPYRVAADGPESAYPPLVSAAMFAWMGFARLVFFGLLLLIARSLWRGELERSVWTLLLIAAGWAPYIAVFAYQRHLVPLLIMDGFLCIALFLVQPRAAAVRRQTAQVVAAAGRGGD